MARIPGFAYAPMPGVQDMGQRPVPQGQRPIVSDQSGEIKGQALENLGNTVTKIGNQIQVKNDQFAYAQAKTNFLQADIQTREALKDDPDYTTYQQRYTEAITKARTEAAKGLNPRDQQTFAVDTQLDLARGTASVQNMVREKEIDTGRSALGTMLDSNRDAALNSTDPAERSQFIAATTDAINGAKQRGYLSAQEAQQHQKKWTQDYAKASIDMLSPDDQIKMLSSPKGTPAEFLPIDKRVDLIDRAQRKRVSDYFMSERLANDEQKKVVQQKVKEGDFLNANGKLTAGWIESNRDILPENEYRHFYQELKGGASESNPRVFAPLLERSLRGEDVSEEARSALYSGDLKQTDYTKIVEKSEAQRPGFVKRGTDYIGGSLAVSQLNPDPGAQASRANALEDWREWTVSHPQATEAEAKKMYESISDHYRIIGADKTILTMHVPTYIVGDRTKPNINATWNRTKEALASGEITQAEYDQQAQLVLRWKQVLDAQALKKSQQASP